MWTETPGILILSASSEKFLMIYLVSPILNEKCFLKCFLIFLLIACGETISVYSGWARAENLAGKHG